uniref:C-type lectin I n=1 Tax=Echis coloratus TaxID=64175 RepID=A0A0A1WCD4_ECHCO
MGRFIPVSFSLLVLFLSLSGTGADFECPPEWSSYDLHCYKAFDKPKRSRDAEKFCTEQAKGGHLASIESSEEGDFVAQLLSKVTEKHITHFWIGLRIVDKEQHCRSEWSDGSSVSYDNLHKRESRKCFALEKETGYRTWFHMYCADSYPFVCKVPPYC